MALSWVRTILVTLGVIWALGMCQQHENAWREERARTDQLVRAVCINTADQTAYARCEIMNRSRLVATDLTP